MNREVDDVRNSHLAIEASRRASCEEEDIAKAFQMGIAFGFVEKCDEMLDKIRAEIAEEAECTIDINRAGGLYKALQIINKYKAESEDKE